MLASACSAVVYKAQSFFQAAGMTPNSFSSPFTLCSPWISLYEAVCVATLLSALSVALEAMSRYPYGPGLWPIDEGQLTEEDSTENGDSS